MQKIHPRRLIFGLLYVPGFVLLNLLVSRYFSPTVLSPWGISLGVSACLMFIGGAGFFPAVWLSIFPTALFVHDNPLDLTLFANTTLTTLGCRGLLWFLRRGLNLDFTRERLRDIIFAVAGAVGLLVLMVLAGVGVQVAGGAIPSRTYWDWVIIYSTDGTLGVLAISPFLLIANRLVLRRDGSPILGFGDRLGFRSSGLQLVEALLQIAGTVLVAWLTLRNFGSTGIHTYYLTLLPLFWAALAFGINGASVNILIFCVAAALVLKPLPINLMEAREFQVFTLIYILGGLFLGGVVTQWNRSVASLKSVSDELDTIFHSVPALIRYKDADNHILRANQSLAEFLGLPLEQINGQSVFKLLPQNAASDYSEDQRVIQTGQPLKGVIESVQTPSGQVRWVQTDRLPLKVEGKAAGVLAFSQDITERRLAEERLDFLLRLERHITSISARFIEANADEIWGVLEGALASLGKFVQVERCFVYLFSQDDSADEQIIEWVQEGLLSMARSSPKLSPEVYQYWMDQCDHEGYLAIDSAEELPAEPPALREEFLDWQQSLILVPIAHQGRALGVLGLANVTRPTKWPAHLEYPLSLVAQVFANAIHRAQIKRAIAESEQRYASLFEKNKVVTLLIDPHTLKIEDANPAACQFYGYSREEMLALKITSINILPPPLVADKLREVVESEEGCRFRFLHRLKNGEVREVNSFAGRLAQNGRTLVYSFVHDLSLQVRAEKESAQRLRYLEALHAIDHAITHSNKLRPALEVVAEQMVACLEMDAGGLTVYDPARKALKGMTLKGFRGDYQKKIVLPLGYSYAGRAAAERTPIHLPCIQEAGEHPETWDREGFVFYYAVPLIAHGELKGVMELFRRSLFTPDKRWLDFLKMLAEQAAIAIDSGMARRRLKQAHEELQRAYDSTLEGWARALELRDEDTEGHSRRVTEMTVRVGRALGMSESEIVHLRRGALLHDIGKMAIPDAILHKPGKLDEDEWALMKQHPVLAHDLLAPIPYLHPALDVAYCHHEKWDGTGYPRGLKGEEIPLSARIFAIVDVWDALLSDRPYRKAWPPEKVLAYLKEQAGTHFDPRVVEIFLEVWLPILEKPDLLSM